MRGIRTLQCALLAAAMAVAAGTSAQAPKPRSYILTTATTGGTYYPVGVAVATLIKVKLQPKLKLDMSAISSAGSGENVKLLRENQAQFAILQGLFGMYAKQGSGALKGDGPQKNIRSITMLWQNVEHFVVTADLAKTGTADDLKGLVGKKFSIGARNSGTEHSNRFLLNNLGIDPEKLDLVFQGYGPSIDALQNGSIVGAGIPGGPPVSVITRAFAQMGNKIRLIEFTREQAAKADGGNDLYNPLVVPAGTYPGQTKDFHTIAQPNFLGVNADVPEEDVYLITKTIYQNLPFLNAIHAATKSMSLKAAIAGLPMPLHPGAAKYYKEAGLAVPDRLMAK
ncbi:MAG: C4-dicarboxylate ABC transporter substrate-binding protein [Betaproteobacteria bacterium RIFCSPLOWO2_02_FULL_63_19]|nr:MAG: C4-dicarboxylate ABC transporter substrate-binding protein [Betaproteobacteria bacterium RIFCSPLOWO2_02_FULL_63_19]